MKWTRLLHEPALRELFSPEGRVGQRVAAIERDALRPRDMEDTTFEAVALQRELALAEREGVLSVMRTLEALSLEEEKAEAKRIAAGETTRRNGNAEAWGLPRSL